MDNEIERFKKLAIDEVLYAKYICKNSPQLIPEGGVIRCLSIPRSSFTAFRLNYASPVEISLSSRSVLLGGVPNLWYTQRKSNVLRSLYHFADKKLRARVRMAGRYTYSMSYRSRRRALRSSSTIAPADVRSNPNMIPVGSSTPPGTALLHEDIEICSRSNSVGDSTSFSSSSSQETKTLAVGQCSRHPEDLTDTDCQDVPVSRPTHSLSDDITRECTHESGNLSFLRRDQTSQSHALVLESDPLPSDSHTHNKIGELRKPKNLDECPPLRPESSRASQRRPSFRYSCYSIQSEPYYSADDGLSSSSDDEDTISDQYPETITSNGSVDVPHFDEILAPQLAVSPSPKARNLAVQFVEQSDRRSQKSSIPKYSVESLSDQIDTAESNFSSDEDEDVLTRLRRAANSRQQDVLQLISPEPGNLTPLESRQISKLESRHGVIKDVKNIVSKTGKRLRIEKLDKLHLDVSRVIGGDSRLSHKFFKRFKAGEAVKMEKMLVCVKSTKSTRGPLLHFSDAEPTDTRLLERWKEYIVVARTTGNSEAPIYLQFYRHRDIPKVESCKGSTTGYRANTMDFELNKSCIVGFYNTLDKTIHVITSAALGSDAEKNKGGKSDDDQNSLKIYIFRCGSSLSAEKWLSFLRKSLGLIDQTDKINVYIPEADLSLEIPLSRTLRRTFDAQTDEENDSLKVLVMPRGYKPLAFPIMRYLELVIRTKLHESGYEKQVSGWIQANTITGFCWKHYDRLEWCPGDQYDLLLGNFSLKASHLLEYRPLTHYPRRVILANGEMLVEPPAVEGFLLRCTNRYGRDNTKFLQKPNSRFLYFFTSDGLLFFMKSYKGLPPLPDDMLSEEASCAYDIEKLEKSIGSLPLSYEHNPYPLDLDSHIEWLNETTTRREFDKKDNAAFASTWRKIAQLIKAEGIIDLTDVKSVSKLSARDEHPNGVKSVYLNGANNLIWKTQHKADNVLDSMFVITLKNGLEVKLLAPCSQVAAEWVTRLSHLSKYWERRKREDSHTMWRVKVDNLTNLRIPESEESNISQDTPKWVTDRGQADDEIHNISAHAMMRPLMQSGILYQKARKHSSFRKYFVILTPGFMILYYYFKSAKINFSKKVVDHRHYMTVPIEECYVYSGNMTSLDLLQRDKQFDHLNPGNDPLPRVYSDGWKSSEDEASRCFTLWFGTKRAISNYNALFKYTAESRAHSSGTNVAADQTWNPHDGSRPTSHSSDGGDLGMDQDLKKNPGLFKVVSRLGVSGRSMVFMARSRQERDQWALKIHSELERLKGPAGPFDDNLNAM